MPRTRSIAALGLLVIGAAAVATAVLLTRGTAPVSAATATIQVGDTWFCSPTFQGSVCDITIPPGDTVSWDFGGAVVTHTTRECGASCDNPTMMPLWDSTLSHGPTFQFTFNQNGTFLYRCEVHPQLMRGRIIVQASPPPPTAPPTSPGGPTPTPERRPGDVDCGGSANSIDAALMLQFNAGLLQSVRCPQNGDVSGDGRTNSLDAALVLQFAAGLITHL